MEAELALGFVLVDLVEERHPEKVGKLLNDSMEHSARRRTYESAAPMVREVLMSLAETSGRLPIRCSQVYRPDGIPVEILTYSRYLSAGRYRRCMQGYSPYYGY